MADVKPAPAAPAIDKAAVAKEVSYIGARLREKSTYGGLAFAIGLAAPTLAHYLPQFGNPGTVAAVAEAIQYLGLGLGMFIGIFLPEKGSPVGKINPLGMGVWLIAIAVAVELLCSPASAATNNFKLPIPLPPLATPQRAPAAAPAPVTDPFEQIMAQLEKVTADDIAAVIADITAADADAGTIITPAIPATATTFGDKRGRARSDRARLLSGRDQVSAIATAGDQADRKARRRAALPAQARFRGAAQGWDPDLSAAGLRAAPRRRDQHLHPDAGLGGRETLAGGAHRHLPGCSAGHVAADDADALIGVP